MSDSMHESGSQKVAIVEAGAIAFATSALLAESGHRPMLWSPSGMGTLALSTTGNLSVERNPTSSDAQPCIQPWTISPQKATSAHELVDQNDVIRIALPANGHKRVTTTPCQSLRSRMAKSSRSTVDDETSHCCYGTTTTARRKLYSQSSWPMCHSVYMSPMIHNFVASSLPSLLSRKL
jgi:hypothetical protein